MEPQGGPGSWPLGRPEKVLVSRVQMSSRCHWSRRSLLPLGRRWMRALQSMSWVEGSVKLSMTCPEVPVSCFIITRVNTGHSISTRILVMKSCHVLVRDPPTVMAALAYLHARCRRAGAISKVSPKEQIFSIKACSKMRLLIVMLIKDATQRLLGGVLNKSPRSPMAPNKKQ